MHRDRSLMRLRSWLAAPVAVATIFAFWLAWTGSAAAQDAATATGEELSVFAAIVLGLVEGLTEYLPISSTGHLLVSNELLGLGGTEDADLALETFAICIQVGAIAAVLLLYRSRVTQVVNGVFGRDNDGRTIAIALIASFVPTAVIGLLLQSAVRDRLFGVTPIAIAWLVGGMVIIWATRSGRGQGGSDPLHAITLRQALIIGVAQSIALWPGVSRSLVTLAAAMAVGLTLAAAVEYAFLLGLITLTAATVFEGLKNGGNLIDTFGYVTPLIGLAVAFVSAIIAVRWMVNWLQSRGLEIFGWYRIVIGVAALFAVAMGWLDT